MAKRSKQEIESDIEKLNELMSTLYALSEGYTIRQRIKHHQKMVDLLDELKEADE